MCILEPGLITEGKDEIYGQNIRSYSPFAEQLLYTTLYTSVAFNDDMSPALCHGINRGWHKIPTLVCNYQQIGSWNFRLKCCYDQPLHTGQSRHSAATNCYR